MTGSLRPGRAPIEAFIEVECTAFSFEVMTRAAVASSAVVLSALATSAQSPREPRMRRPGDRPAANIHSTRSVVMGRHGMIATSQPLASAAGLRVMQEGGNAIDAAVTAAAVLAVVEPSMTGIGGDLFAIVYDAKTKTLKALNASGRSGHAATPAEFAKRGQTRDARRRSALRYRSGRG